MTDGNGGSDTATVVVTINAVNDAPSAVDDTVTTPEGTSVTILILGNDDDIDGDTLTTVITSNGPSNGSVVVNPDGTITYKPDVGFNGTDTFVYTVSDGNGGTATATVIVSVTPVNDLPVAANDTAATDEDSPVTISVLGNDGDPDGDILTVTSAGPAGNGGVVVHLDGTVTYTPDANFCGVDTFAYTVSDGNGGTATATVTVNVNCVNDAPVALDNNYSVNRDAPVSGNVVLDNTGEGVDSDPDGDMLTASGPVIAPMNGSVVINPDGTFTYTPNIGYSGGDSFVYQIDDDNGGTAVATVTITVVANPTDCGACDGKVTELTLRYDGPGTVNVKIVQHKGEIAFDGAVSSGGTFTAVGQDKHGTLSPKVKVYIDGVLDTEIHTSCSVPIGPGQVWGSFTIIEGFSRNGGRLCPVGSGGSGSDCGGCDGKVTALTLRYDGSGSVFVQVKQKDGSRVFSDIVSSGQEFSFVGVDNKGTLDTSIKVYSNCALAAEFHTSCSVPIGPGSSDGAFAVVAGTSRNGGALCPVDAGSND